MLTNLDAFKRLGLECQKLLLQIVQRNGLQEEFLCKSLEFLSTDEVHSFSSYVEYLHHVEKLTVDYMAASYDTLVRDIFREQVYFRRHRSYRYRQYEDVKHFVYYDNEYMRRYMYGLALSSFLWRQHVAMRRWFNQRVPRHVPGRYLEVGPGHGYYFMDVMRTTAYDHFTAVDVSPESVRMTTTLLKSGFYGSFRRYEVTLEDFLLHSPLQKYDALVMAEVLEHVETPDVFLEKLHRLSHSEAFVYVTTVVNAPAIDHLTLFRSPAEVLACVQEAGFEIKDYIVVGVPDGFTLEQAISNLIPLNIAMCLAL